MIIIKKILWIFLIFGLCFAEFSNILFFFNVPEFFPGQFYLDCFLIISLVKIILNEAISYEIKYFSKTILLVGAFLNSSIMFLTILASYLGNKNINLFQEQWIFDLISLISLIYITIKYKYSFGCSSVLLFKKTFATIFLLCVTFIIVDVV